MALRTPLEEVHRDLGARFTEFGGWFMPLRYSSALRETIAVREAVGIFDVSHMGRIVISGGGARSFLNYATSNSIPGRPGRTRYTLFLNNLGGIKDDDIAMVLEDTKYILVVNAASREKIISWIDEVRESWGGSELSVEDETEETAMVAVQGPKAVQTVREILGENLPGRKFRVAHLEDRGLVVSRTGYTGEDGYEIIFFDQDEGATFFREAVAMGAQPCGLEARDILRLEAGLPLYGEDMNEETDPFEADLEFAVDMEKEDFIGKEALEKKRDRGREKKRVGLRATGRRAPRPGDRLLTGDGEEVGIVTSGAFSPTIGLGIGMGYVQIESSRPGTRLSSLGPRGKISVEVVETPFYDQDRYGWKRKVQG